MGLSMGGELAPRAAAYEKRIAALVANDGVFDYGAANLAHVPPDERAAFKQGLQAKSAPGVDHAIEAMMNAGYSTRQDWLRRTKIPRLLSNESCLRMDRRRTTWQS